MLALLEYLFFRYHVSSFAELGTNYEVPNINLYTQRYKLNSTGVAKSRISTWDALTKTWLQMYSMIQGPF